VNERRGGALPTSTIGYLQQLPALVLLDRLLVPVLAVDLDGELTYANPAFASILGYSDAEALTGQWVCTLLDRRAADSPRDCVATLRAARGTLVDWCHSEGYVIKTLVSDSMLLRSTDPLLLVSVSDMTEWVWTNSREP
jgi:PAS domain S-box-containing protein